MKRVLCLLADGVEETELVAPVDILRRCGVEVVMASVTGAPHVSGKHGIVLGVDADLADLDPGGFDALFLPGGPAVMTLRQDSRIGDLAKSFAASGRTVAAICAAPLLLLDAGLLEGRRYTAHQSTYGELGDAEADQRVVVDGNLITSRGAGTAVDFGLALGAHLVGAEVANEVSQAIMA